MFERLIFMGLFIKLLVYSIYGSIWGFAVKKIVENKGYRENWFWWGFFFGPIALIVALTKPERHNYNYSAGSNYISPLSAAVKENEHEKIMAEGGWSCVCGRDNASYVGTCSCGRRKEHVLEEQKRKREEGELLQRLETLKKYKEMLDAGLISQEEFDRKKKEYIGVETDDRDSGEIVPETGQPEEESEKEDSETGQPVDESEKDGSETGQPVKKSEKQESEIKNLEEDEKAIVSKTEQIQASDGKASGGKMRFCGKCGNKLSGRAKFCNKCGSRVERMESSPKQEAPLQESDSQSAPPQVRQNVIQLENCVQEDITIEDANALIRKEPWKRYTFDAWDEMINEPDAAWCLHGQQPILDMVPFGRMRINSFLERDNRAAQNILDKIREQEQIRNVGAMTGALLTQKKFDMTIKYLDLEAEAKDVSQTVKTGFNEKGIVNEREKKEKFVYVEKEMTFSGWNLAHFERTYEFGRKGADDAYYRKLNWDFVLGDDGDIYHITSGYTVYNHPFHLNSKGDAFFYQVRKAIYYDMCFLKNKNQAYFIAVSHGVYLTIEHILQELKTLSGKCQVCQEVNENEKYTYNFPISPTQESQIGSMSNINEKLQSFVDEGLKTG